MATDAAMHRSVRWLNGGLEGHVLHRLSPDPAVNTSPHYAVDAKIPDWRCKMTRDCQRPAVARARRRVRGDLPAARAAAGVLMPRLWWLVFRQGDVVTVQIIEAFSLAAARLRSDIETPGIGAHFAEGDELDEATAAKVPKGAIGRTMTAAEAAVLLARRDRR